MPKQRNRQHHHARSERRGDGLQLPTVEWFLRGQRIIYPPGWKTKWPNEQAPIMLSMFIILGGVAAVLILAALVMTFFLQ